MALSISLRLFVPGPERQIPTRGRPPRVPAASAPSFVRRPGQKCPAGSKLTPLSPPFCPVEQERALRSAPPLRGLPEQRQNRAAVNLSSERTAGTVSSPRAV